MNHRKTISRNVFVPATWFLVLTMLVCVGGATWLGWLLVDGSGGSSPVAATPASATTATPTPTPTPTPTETTPTPTPKPTKKKTTPAPTDPPAPAVKRDVAVSVLNNTRTPGLAGTFAAKVRAAGWVVGGVGNWRGSVQGNAVYYPAGMLDRADLLARDVGIGRVAPSLPNMRTDRLTIILAGPQ